MAVSLRRRLGPYELLGSIGAGGMGEVYRARDSRLDRTVAIKLLPERLSSDPELVERFTREARAVSALSHPNVCALYDVGREDGADFLVMEYLEGETLADRIAKGPLPLDQVTRFGAQIASALDAAHRRGIVHRDLKPSNVMLTKSGVKLLDFGLAKIGARKDTAAVSRLATAAMSTPLTEKGTLLGTVPYMAPEQLEGKEADVRTDIFALGAVLYEMACGRRAFQGESQASLIASILSSEPPPLTSIQRLAPHALERVVKTCLAKIPDDRWQSAHDVSIELHAIAEAPEALPSSVSRRARLPWLAAGAAVAVAALALVLAARALREARDDAHRVRLALLAPEGGAFARILGFALSPDGSRLAFVARGREGPMRLWLRPLDGDARPLDDTEGAAFPFWSPDGAWIAFFADGRLKKIAPAGGPAQTICEAPAGRGGAWGPDGTIVFSAHMIAGLSRVSSAGGVPQPLTTFDASRHDVSHRWPSFLPDGRRFLFTIHADPEKTGVYVGSLDGAPPRLLMRGTSQALASAPGQLLFVRDGNLMAQAFDARSASLSGDAVPIARRVAFFRPFDSADFSVSGGGVLVFRPSDLVPARLVWFDRSGKTSGPLGAAGGWSIPRISPDGTRVAALRFAPETGEGDIWVFDAGRDNPARLTMQPSVSPDIVWSPDGKRIAFGSNRTGFLDLYVLAADGSGTETPLLKAIDYMIPTSWSADGRLLLMKSSPITGWDLSVLDLASGAVRTFLATPFSDTAGTFSPDGRVVAYVSNASGRYEVYVRGADGGGERLVSSAGGEGPRWRADGRELFYVSNGRQLMSVPFPEGPSGTPGVPTLLFETRGLTSEIGIAASYDVAPDGRRFIVAVPTEDPPVASLTVVTGWASALRSR